MYKDTAMKIIHADMTDTTKTSILLVARMAIDTEMARTIPGAMSGQMIDTKINGHPITQIYTIIIIKN